MTTGGGPARSGRRAQRVALAGVLLAGALVAGVLVARRSPSTTASPASTPASVHFAVIGDMGSNNADEAAVAALVAADDPDFVATVGDNAYGAAGQDLAVGQYYHSFIGAYSGSYGAGSATNRFFPALGNHDISDGTGLPGYLSFYTLPGAGTTSLRPSGNERYYDVVQGPVHLFFVNSDPSEASGRTASSAQATWLRNGLAASPSPWNVVVFHHAAFSSSTGHGSTTTLQWPFESWGADLVLNGHDHTYERIVRDDDGDGTPLTYVVDGLGGQSPYGFGTPVPGSQVRYNADHGALFVDADATTLSASFRTVGGSTVDTFTLTAPAPGHIVGTVTDAHGAPLPGAMVHAIDYGADPSIILGDVTDPSGHYDISVPAPDSYALAILDASGANAFEYHEDDQAIDPADDVVVAAGATVTVDVALAQAPGAPGTLHGTVTDGTDGLAGIWVTVVSVAGVPTRSTVTDGAGAYDVTGLAPGSYKLIFVDPAGNRRWEYHTDAASWADATPVAVTAGGDATVDAVLTPAL